MITYQPGEYGSLCKHASTSVAGLVSEDMVYESLLRRGVFKWLAVRQANLTAMSVAGKY